MESKMNKTSESKAQTYQITVIGKLDESWQNLYENFSLSRESDSQGKTLTILSGTVIDQAALRGLVNKLWDLNLYLISVVSLDKGE
jgi:hypothetical protein